MILATAHQDGRDVSICLPQDPGAAGVSQVSSWSRMLAGFTFRFVRPTGDKITRAGPVSSQSQAGNVCIVSAEWNGEWLSELEAFPESKNDDQVDSLADAFNALVRRAADALATDDVGAAVATFHLDHSPLGF